MKTMILYHHPCTDGFCSAWIAHKIFHDAEFVPVSHGAPQPDVTGAKVFMLDFSYKKPVLLDMIEQSHSFTILDHHEGAEADLLSFRDVLDLRHKTFVIFDKKRSGAMLTWDHFYPGKMPPLIVNYVQDRDLWTWQLNHSKEISAFIASYPKHFTTWDGLSHRISSDGFHECVIEGRSIIRYQQQVIEEHVSHAVEYNIAGYKVLVTNCTNAGLISEVGERLAADRAFGVTFFHRLKDNKYVFSIRSRPPVGVDCISIAKSFGGNGHKQAAGFQLDNFPFNKLDSKVMVYE